MHDRLSVLDFIMKANHGKTDRKKSSSFSLPLENRVVLVLVRSISFKTSLKYD